MLSFEREVQSVPEHFLINGSVIPFLSSLLSRSVR